MGSEQINTNPITMENIKSRKWIEIATIWVPKNHYINLISDVEKFNLDIYKTFITNWQRFENDDYIGFIHFLEEFPICKLLPESQISYEIKDVVFFDDVHHDNGAITRTLKECNVVVHNIDTIKIIHITEDDIIKEPFVFYNIISNENNIDSKERPILRQSNRYYRDIGIIDKGLLLLFRIVRFFGLRR